MPTSLSQLEQLGDYDPNAMPVEKAREFIRQFLRPVTATENVELAAALHRTLAEDVLSPINVPPHDNSAMDGFALRFADLGAEAATMTIAGESFAGHPYTGSLNAGECVKIMTGAVIPESCDTVVMQEHVRVSGNRAEIGSGHRAGQNIRRAGEDIRQNSVALAQGTFIRAAELGLLASVGVARVPVYRRLKVAFFSTGDELRQPGERLAAGQIHDSNRYTLRGLLTELNAEILDMGSVADDRDSLKKALLDAASRADVVITSGGVSVGEADYIKALLAEIGEVVFWKIAMKPGKPLAYGKIGSAHFFGLPGNPVAVMVTFLQFVSEALRILMGQRIQPALTFKVKCASPFKKSPGRTEFQRGLLSRNAQGELVVSSTGNQSSGALSSMSRANCLVILPAGAGNVAAGDTVEVQPLYS
jgi:molybdopterin molybdotransferase